MLTCGAKHPGGNSVPAIRVGAGGHRPRRTSQHVLIRSLQHARGRRGRSKVEQENMYETSRFPLPSLRGGALARPFSSIYKRVRSSPRRRAMSAAEVPAFGRAPSETVDIAEAARLAARRRERIMSI